jgi:predicted ABC-type ATPase
VVEAGINEDEVKRALGIIVIVWQPADEIIIYNNSRELKRYVVLSEAIILLVGKWFKRTLKM